MGTTADGHGLDVWRSPRWRADAASWLDERLAAAGMVRTGEVEQPHLRAWGTALRAPTSHGPMWLKAPGPGTAFEVALYPLLSRLAPDQVLQPIAADPARGWLALPDSGSTLGDRVDGPELVDAMVAILPHYGQLQRALAPHVDELIEVGVADMRAAIMPERFDEALVAAGGYVEEFGTAADRATLDRVAAFRDVFVSWCDRLAELPVAPSLDHNDLHPWNVFVAGADGAGPPRFYDWGDSVVAHPFSSMLVTLGYLHRTFGGDLDAPVVTGPRDAYLEVFGDLASRADLLEAVRLACQVGKVARALTWHRSLLAQGYGEAGDHARATLQWLAAVLDASYLGLEAQE